MRIKHLRIAEWRVYHPRELPVEEAEFLTLNGSAECHRAYPTTANNTIPRTMVLPRAVTSRAASCSQGGPMGTDGLLGWRNASKAVRSNASGSPSITSSAMRLKVIRSTAITRTDLNSDDSERHALKILCQASDILFAPHGLDLPCITDVAAVTSTDAKADPGPTCECPLRVQTHKTSRRAYVFRTASDSRR
jgi:hypothetical protein